MPCITCQVLIRTPLVVPSSVAFSTSTSETQAHELFAPRLPMLQQEQQTTSRKGFHTNAKFEHGIPTVSIGHWMWHSLQTRAEFKFSWIVII